MASSAMTEASFNKLLEVLKNANTLDASANIKMTDVVDNSFALKI